MSVATFFSSKSILITGASSGIGEELALQLAAAGAHLTLTARRRELLDALAQKISAAGHETPLVVPADVTRDGDLDRAVSEALRAYHKLETNVFGRIRTLHAALPEIQRSHGSLVLIGSVAGWAASPGASPYAMSK